MCLLRGMEKIRFISSLAAKKTVMRRGIKMLRLSGTDNEFTEFGGRVIIILRSKERE